MTRQADPVKAWQQRRRLTRWLGLCTLVCGVALLGRTASKALNTHFKRAPQAPSVVAVPPPPPQDFIPVTDANRPIARATAHAADSGHAPAHEPTFGELMDELIDEINAARATAPTCVNREHDPAGPLIIKGTLESAASVQAVWMVQADDYAHRTPDNPAGTTPQQRAERAGYQGQFIGENLAWGMEEPNQTVRWWLNSPSHCTVLMNSNATEIGVGIEPDPDTPNGWIWVMVVGRP